MSIATQLRNPETRKAIPSTMQALVYHGVNDVRLQEVPVPEIGAGELLIRVHTCGICGTDLKKIATGSHSAPRIFGHETTGVIAAVGDGVDGLRRWRSGDGLPSHPVRRLLLLRAQGFRPVSDLQESRRHRRIRAQRRGIFRVRSRDGLDRRAGAGWFGFQMACRSSRLRSSSR